MNLSKQILKNHSSIFSVTLSIFVFTTISMPVQAGKIEETAQQTTVQINSEGNGSPGGSGVIIDKQGKTYTVLTANHVVCDAIQGRKQVICTTDVIYTIRTYAGKNYPIKDRQSLELKIKLKPSCRDVPWNVSIFLRICLIIYLAVIPHSAGNLSLKNYDQKNYPPRERNR